MEKFNIIEQPIEKDTFEDWIKIAIDITKVAILSIPVILYGDESLSFKIVNISLLICGVYLGLFSARKFRKMKKETL